MLEDVQYTSGYDGDDSTTPITISSYWLYKFSNQTADNYYAWEKLSQISPLKIGEGFTMKGTSDKPLTDEQNYSFLGMPNNGDITLTLDAGNEYLVGNPYPSALDANQFLTDNQNTIEGTLYFWDHYGGYSHYLKEYEGGYAMYNLSGSVGAAATVPAVGVSPGGGPGTKVPTQYIPIAQGFFIKSATSQSSTDVVFKNSQRVYNREKYDNSIFVKEAISKNTKTTVVKTGDVRPKIRLKFQSPEGYLRQLLTTVDKNATLTYDWGYDAPVNEDNLEDMFWNIEQSEYFIQGIDTITKQTILPLSVKTKAGGLIEIKIDSLENAAQDYNIYLKDYDTYHDLKAGSFFATVTSGLISDRFAIAFSNKENALDLVEENVKSLGLFYNKNSSSIIINNPKSLNIESFKAVNMLGQVVFEYPIHASDKQISFQSSLSSGVYLFSIETSAAEITKKLVISK